MMKLLVGLGNPGETYAGNRHNVGFMAVDAIRERWRGGPWRPKFQSDVSEATVDGVRVMFLKPHTYMNESGRAVAEAARFYKVKIDDILVAHDEIDLLPGKFRMKAGGGTGGHNGLKSISAHINDGYRRLRIGVGHPGRKEAVPGYVLHDFSKADRDWLIPLLEAFASEAPLLVRAEDSLFASKVYARLGTADGAERRPPPMVLPTPPAPKPATGGERRPSPFSALAHLLRK